MASATWSLTQLDIDAVSATLAGNAEASFGVLHGAEKEIDSLFS